MDCRANPLMDQKVVAVLLLEYLQWLQWPSHPQLLDEVWCSAAVVAVVVVVQCNERNAVAVAAVVWRNECSVT